MGDHIDSVNEKGNVMTVSSDGDANSRELPSLTLWLIALRFFYDRRSRKSIITLIFKLVIHSRKQERNLLKPFVCVTQLVYRILEALRESPNQIRTDGAFALFLEMLDVRAAK